MGTILMLCMLLLLLLHDAGRHADRQLRAPHMPSPPLLLPCPDLPCRLLQVRIAQQSSDDACLAHALASLCQILDATTPGTITSVTQAPRSSPAARHYSQLNQLLRRCLRWVGVCMVRKGSTPTALAGSLSLPQLCCSPPAGAWLACLPACCHAGAARSFSCRTWWPLAG
jgi:hypothetical protein